jgi:hypothetical protein
MDLWTILNTVQPDPLVVLQSLPAHLHRLEHCDLIFIWLPLQLQIVLPG